MWVRVSPGVQQSGYIIYVTYYKGILNEIMKQNKLMMEEMQNKYEAKLALQMENFRREINELP